MPLPTAEKEHKPQIPSIESWMWVSNNATHRDGFIKLSQHTTSKHKSSSYTTRLMATGSRLNVTDEDGNKIEAPHFICCRLTWKEGLKWPMAMLAAWFCGSFSGTTHRINWVWAWWFHSSYRSGLAFRLEIFINRDYIPTMKCQLEK